MAKYLLITGDACPYCDKAKQIITERDDEYVEVNLYENPELHIVMQAVGQQTVPLVLEIVGGADDL